MLPINTNRQSKILSDQLIDNRENLFNLENIKKEDVDLGFPALIEQGRSVACLMREESLLKNSDNTWTLKRSKMCSLSQFLPLALAKDNPNSFTDLFTSNLRFAKEPTFGYATGFLVQKNGKPRGEGSKYLVTAAHALCNLKTKELDPEIVKTIRVVFDYHMNESNNFDKVFKTIYEIKKVVDFKFETHQLGTTIGDWALIKLKDAVKDRSPLEIAKKPEGLKSNTPIYTLGYPMGTPLKYTHSGKTQFVGTNVVKHTLLTFPCSSGSPVFNAAGEVIGIIIRGPKSYSIDPQTNEIDLCAYDRDTASFEYAPWFQKMTPLCEILNAPPKVVVNPPPCKSLKLPPKEPPSSWEEIKNIGYTVIHAPNAVAIDFLEEPSIEKGLKWGITWGGSALSAGALGAMIPATAAGGPLILLGAAVTGLVGTAGIATGIGSVYMTIRRAIT
jgi:hypothetical protein